MGLHKLHTARSRSKQAAAPKTESPNFGFNENLSAADEMEKLLGHNFIDDGGLLEADGTDPAQSVRARLASMDKLALDIRKGLNQLVREGVGMTEEAQYLELGEGSKVLASMKPAIGRLMTAYTELVSGLQKARESVGYDIEGPSVTAVGDEGEVHERITRRFGQRQTSQYVRESASAGGDELYKALTAAEKDAAKRADAAQNLAHALGGIASELQAFGSQDSTADRIADTKKALRRLGKMIPATLLKHAAINFEGLVKLVAQHTRASDQQDALNAEAARLQRVAAEVGTAERAAHAAMGM